MLEIGLAGGSSAQLWDDFFQHNVQITGVDMGGGPYQQTDSLHIFHGDQSNGTFLDEVLAATGGGFDLIVDDGSHLPGDQIFRLWLC